MMKKIVLIFLVLSFVNVVAQENWSTAASEIYQQQLNIDFQDPNESPLTDADFKTFQGLDFYPIQSKYIVEAECVKLEKQKAFKMKTTGERLPEYIKYGELHFSIDGMKMMLYVYQNVELSKKEGFEDSLFLPFSDLSCGQESYLGGRYIDLRFPRSKTVIIDFNKAYNPYCAYNSKYSCPIVPLENDLKIAILAGVKKFHD